MPKGGDDFGGGLWILVAVNSVLFIAFAASFFHPHSRRDWPVMGAQFERPFDRAATGTRWRLRVVGVLAAATLLTFQSLEGLRFG